MSAEKRVMIVTGGSRGIGSATAKLASLYGFKVCVNYFTHEKEANKVLMYGFNHRHHDSIKKMKKLIIRL